MILTLTRTALLLPLAVKEKSVQLLGVQIPFTVQTVRVRTIRDMTGRKRWCNLIKRQHCKDDFFVTNSTVICSDHFKTEDIKKTLAGRWDLVYGLSF